MKVEGLEVRNLLSASIALVSVNDSFDQGNGHSDSATISADGRFVAFLSDASNLVPGDTNHTDIFLLDRQTQKISRISVDPTGNQADFSSASPTISADGRFVAFASEATTLVTDDTNTSSDIFVYDRILGQISRVSVNSAGIQGNHSSVSPSISANGRYVTFSSGSTNLVPDDTNGSSDIFLYDRQVDQIRRISVDSAGVQGDGSSFDPHISEDGKFVAYQSYAHNLVPDDTSTDFEIFLYEVQTGLTTRVSVDSNGVQGNRNSFEPSVSGDGHFVTYRSQSFNLVPNDTNNNYDIFLYNRLTGQTECVSVDSSGNQQDGNAFNPSISSDGRYITYESNASNLVPNDSNGQYDIFKYDRLAQSTTLVTVAASGEQGNGNSTNATISSSGRFVLFTSQATNIVPSDTNGAVDVFVYDHEAFFTRLLVPLYQFPTFTDGTRTQLSGWWRDIQDQANVDNPVTVIVNPSNGTADPMVAGSDFAVYLDAIRLLASNPYVEVLGYVYTQGGSRAIGQVTQNVDWYDQFYTTPSGQSLIDGIFVDELAPGISQLSYYETLATHIRTRPQLANHFIMANPGVVPQVGMLSSTVADAFLTFENVEDSAAPGDVDFVDALPPTGGSPGLQFAAIVHGAPNASDRDRLVRSAKLKGYDYFYVTHDVSPNPFDVQPTYWNGLFTELHRPVAPDVTLSLAENTANSTSVATIVGFDPSPGQTVTYAITGGNTNNAFAIDPNTGVVSVNDSAALDFETNPVFTLTIGLTDNGVPSSSGTSTLTINLTDVVEGGLTDIVMHGVSLNGGSQLTVTYEIVGNAVSAFEIGLYWSHDGLRDPADPLIDWISVGNAADRTVGLHSLSLTIGVDIDLPAGFAYDPLIYDQIVVVLDDQNVIAEDDAPDYFGAFNEDNSAALHGVYHPTNGVVVALGSGINDSMVVTASGANLNLNFNGTVYTYLASSVSGFSFRGQDGNDTLTAVNIDKPVTLMGGNGNDVLTGGKQADFIVDGDGSDTITGGLGNDWYIRDEDLLTGSDTLTDAGGVDTLDFSRTEFRNVTFNLSLTTVQEPTPGNFLKLASASAIDNIIGGGLNDVLTGNTLANRIDGGFGNDTLVGGSGNDFYVGNLGTDTLIDSAGIDTLDFSGYVDAFTVNLSLTTLQATNLYGSLTLNSATAFENIIGGENDDLLIGNTAINRIEGRGGNDTLQGAAGNDIYIRDEDNDLGSDVITDSAGLDTLDFSPTSSARNVTVSLALITTQETTSGNFLTLTSATMIENVTGGAGNDNLIGNTLVNTFNGGAGNDTLNGGAGNDVYPFDVDLVLGTDTIIDSAGLDRIDFAISTAAVSMNLGLTGNQTVRSGFLVLNLASATSIENLTGGAGHDTLIGNSLANSILGNKGNDNIQGAGGNDSLTGGAGNDTLAGGLGDDKYLFPAASGTENDRISELAGEGVDLLDFSTLSVAVTVNLTSATVATHTGRTITAAGGEEANFDNVTGSKVNDSITGNALNNNLIGGIGNDVLDGGSGNDTLEGAAGNDTLIGGLGDDNYLFKAAVGSEADVIFEYVGEGIDLLNFSGLASSVPVNVSLISNTLATHNGRTVTTGVAGMFDNLENVTGGAGNDTIVGNSNHNVLIGGSGNDTISGGAGDDTIQGVAGNDTLDGGADTDTIDGGTGTDTALNGETVTNVP